MTTDRYVKLAVDAPLAEMLTYKVNPAWPKGSSVIAPLGKRKVSAVILDESDFSDKYQIKEVLALDENRPVLSPKYLQWLTWISEYYVHPIGQVISLCFPPLANRNSKKISKKPPVVQQFDERTKAPELTNDQATCLRNIQSKTGFQSHLLFGVTGSGKTEVYLQLLNEVIKKGQRGLVLVPEISLTPQLIQRFSSRFGDQIAVLHSHLTDRERTNQWWSIVSGDKKILIGARSALFCPLENLGLIVVDEEHEPSYKQEEKLRYNARDAAIMLAKFHDIPIVLGSATPSLETWQNAQSGKYNLHTMGQRVADRKLPQIDVIDLRADKNKMPAESLDIQKLNDRRPRWMSSLLYEKMEATLKRNEQVALFLNRRGVAPTVLCSDCGFVYKCPNCAITLTLHGQKNLVCHYCDYNIQKEEVCPSCKTGEPKSIGLGTEQIETELQKMFPDKTVARADRDEIHSRETLENLIRRMESHEIDILVGTQMIAKGLDFPKLTLVGLVLADIGFNMPDFRATERSFQLLTQVSGRSGRHVVDGGAVVIQTYNPEYPALLFSKLTDYEGFAQAELNLRKELHYPPYGRLATLKIVGNTFDLGSHVSDVLADRASALIAMYPAYKDIQVLGPVPAPIAKLRGKFRFHILLKSTAPHILSTFCRQLLADKTWITPGTKVQVDIDPINLL